MMHTSPRMTIGVGAALAPDVWRLLPSLAQLFPVEFQRRRPGEYDGLDALVVVDSPVDAGLSAAAGLPTYQIMALDSGRGTSTSGEVRFSDSVGLDDCLRGRVMEDSESGCFGALPVEANDECLASRDGQPVWLRRRLERGWLDIVGLGLPSLESEDCLFKDFQAGRFMRLLPLIHFLKALTKDVDWQPAPTRACFVFDDPSLYSSSYGFLNFEALASHARRHDYYVSIATIPLDCWLPSARVIWTLRESAPRVSVLIHGNNHTQQELARSRPPAENLGLLAQALRRWERLDGERGVEACRVMEAPHGAIVEEMLEPMAALGYEAALGTSDLMLRFNPKRKAPRTFGLDQGELRRGCVPVIPRIKMSAQWKTDVLLAAFLQQPIAVAGHHWDAAEQLELLAEFASFVNNLKGVTWASPLGIARSNFKQIRQGEVLDLKLYSRRIQVPVPEGVRSLFVHRTYLRNEAEGEMLVVKSAGQDRFRGVGTEVVGPIPVTAPEVLEIHSPPANPIDYRSVPPPRFRCWPVVRKALMEARDRSGPWRYRAGELFRSSRSG